MQATDNAKPGAAATGAQRPLALIVEDEPDVARLHMHLLAGCGFRHEWAANAELAEQMLRAQKFDLILLDLRLPGKSGEVFLRQLRSAGNDTGVIVITGFGDIDTKVTLLGAGADDFVSKPFNIADLEARILALSRRVHGQRVRSLFDGRLKLDPASTSVIAGSLSTRLTATEFGIMWLLSTSPHAPVSPTTILEEVFGDQAGAMSGALRTAMSRLRTKLSALTSEVYLENEREAGYRLVTGGQH